MANGDFFIASEAMVCLAGDFFFFRSVFMFSQSRTEICFGLFFDQKHKTMCCLLTFLVPFFVSHFCRNPTPKSPDSGGGVMVPRDERAMVQLKTAMF